MGVFSGHKDLKAIMRFANRTTLSQRKKLALPGFKKGSRYKKIPSYTAVYQSTLMGLQDGQKTRSAGISNAFITSQVS